MSFRKKGTRAIQQARKRKKSQYWRKSYAYENFWFIQTRVRNYGVVSFPPTEVEDA